MFIGTRLVMDWCCNLHFLQVFGFRKRFDHPGGCFEYSIKSAINWDREFFNFNNLNQKGKKILCAARAALCWLSHIDGRANNGDTSQVLFLKSIVYSINSHSLTLFFSFFSLSQFNNIHLSRRARQGLAPGVACFNLKNILSAI